MKDEIQQVANSYRAGLCLPGSIVAGGQWDEFFSVLFTSTLFVIVPFALPTVNDRPC
jgi:hypothetical protein